MSYIIRMLNEDKERSGHTGGGAQRKEASKQDWVCLDSLGQFLGNQTAEQSIEEPAHLLWESEGHKGYVGLQRKYVQLGLSEGILLKLGTWAKRQALEDRL